MSTRPISLQSTLRRDAEDESPQRRPVSHYPRRYHVAFRDLRRRTVDSDGCSHLQRRPAGLDDDPATAVRTPYDGAQIEVDEENVGDALLFYASVDARDDGLYTTTSRSFVDCSSAVEVRTSRRDGQIQWPLKM